MEPNQIKTKANTLCTIDPVLYHWLKNKRIKNIRIWGKYKKNIQNWGHYMFVDTIGGSFPWLDTPQGIGFWTKIDEQFCRYHNVLSRKKILFENFKNTNHNEGLEDCSF